jgi:hypothetical protein
MHQPVKIGSAVHYFRTHPEAQSLDAFLLAYDVLPASAKDDAVPTAKLAIIEPKNFGLLRDANWVDAFSVVDQVPYQPTGEYYHGWSETSDQARVAQPEAAVDQGSEALFAKDAEIEALRKTNLELGGHIVELQAQIAAYDKGPDPGGQPSAIAPAAVGEAGQAEQVNVETAMGSDNLVQMPDASNLGPTS